MNASFRAVMAGIVLMLVMVVPAQAMPPFAQAYGMKCEVCHTQVPSLNAYGRYVQRTGYSSLDSHVLRRSTPIWIGESANYDSQDPNEPHKVVFGNLALHAAGAFSENMTFHFQQWITQANQSGGLDSAWITYNNLLHRDGHLFVGKMPAPGPSALSQWSDLASFSTPEITVGEHPYQLDANRWGSKFNYVHGALDLEAGYFGSGADLSGATDWSSSIDKTFQWKIANANPERPLEYGLFGSRGSFPLAEGDTDQYHSLNAYVQRDPTRPLPGILLMYMTGYDSNPGPGLDPARSNAATIELYQPLGSRALISIRKEFANDGLGLQTQSGNVDFAYHLAPYLHLYVESAFAQNSTPSWKYMVWWTLPLQKVK